MASTIPNQPIVFDQEAECWLEDSGMIILAEHGDITQFQMQLEPCYADVNVVQGGNFQDASLWTASGGWSVGGGSACHAVGVSGALTQLAPATDGTICRLTITVEASTTGAGVTIFWGTYIGNLGAGTHTVWIEASSANAFSITANGSNGVCVRDLQLITVNTNFSVAIVDSDTLVAVDAIQTADGYFNFADGFFTCNIDWETLAIPSGCYKIVVVDPCPCSQRGIVALDFYTGTWNWSLASQWTVSGGQADFSGSATGVALLSNTICSGLSYSVTYTISGLTGTVDAQIGLGSQYGTARTANGTYTETIVSNGTGFRLKGTPTGAASFTVTDVEIEEVIPSSLIFSNTIKVSEDELSCTTPLLSMCNDSDAFGFGFVNTGFAPSMRIPASLTRSSYPMERMAYDNSNGRKAVYYGRQRKAKELGFDGVEFMHDFASKWLIADHFYIDGIEYFVEDEEYPSISWSDGDDVGGITLIVSEKVQLNENRRLSSAILGCSVNGTVLTTEGSSGLVFELVTEDGRKLITG